MGNYFWKPAEDNPIKNESSIIINQAKDKVHKILKRKDLNTYESIDKIQQEIEIRFNQRVLEITPRIEKTKFDNPETSLKLILTKVMIEILKQLFIEKMIALDEEDKKILNDVFK